MQPLLRWIDRRAGACLVVWAVLLGVVVAYLAWAGPRLALDADPTVLHPRPNPPLDAGAHIEKKMGMAPDSLIVYLHADDSQQLFTLAHHVDQRLASPAAREAGVASTLGLATLLPDPAEAPRRLAQVGPAVADRVVADFDAALAQSAFDPKAYEGYRAFLRILLTPSGPPGVADLAGFPQLAGNLLPREAQVTPAATTPGASTSPAVTEALTLVFLDKPMESPAESEAFVAKIRGLLADLPGATPTGMSVLRLDTQETIHRDLPRLTVVAVGIIALYLLLHFRSVTQTLLAVLPTLCSIATLLAVARFAGAKMNLANIVAVPLLIGIDTDYGIFLVSVARRSRTRAELLERVGPSSRAVVLCAAATLLGFGSLAFTSVPAVRSLGWAVAIGVSTCAAAALFLLLPLLLWIRGRRETGVQGGGDELAPTQASPGANDRGLPAAAMKEFRSWSARFTKSGAAGSVHRLGIGALTALSLILICLLLASTGCAPSDHLSFPSHPLRITDNVEWYDVRHNGLGQFGVAHGPDGRVDQILYCDAGEGRADHATREYRLSDYPNERVPHLILLLDSIPFETMRERYAAGDFGWFDAPRKMIAPFPSMTQVCYSDVLHCPPLEGTSDESFDPRTGSRENKQWSRLLGHDLPYEQRLTYRADFVSQAMAYLDPDPWYRAELERVRRAVEESPDRVTVCYIGSASSMVCKFGKAGAERVLDGARQLSLQLLYERRGAIKISVMADHGHNYTPSRNVPLEKYLGNAGFHPADQIRKPTDCVVDINALVTYAGVHTPRPDAVAAALCAHEEIELAIYQQGDRTILRTGRGAAAVECRGRRLRYVPLDADVLAYAPVIERLKVEGKMDADGYADDDAWFRATLDHPWPNAPRRAWDALHGKFIHPPDVMLSIKDGYYAGNPAYEKYIKMASTHGGMNQVNSATFVMTMTGRVSRAVHHEDVLGELEPGYEPPVRK